MILIENLNWLAIAAAVIANMGLGALWYSPLLFGPMRLEATGKKQEDIKGGGAAVATSIIPAFLVSVGIAILVSATLIDTWGEGITMGLFTWVCFALPTLWLEVIFHDKPLKVFLINNGNLAISYMTIGAIVGGWQ